MLYMMRTINTMHFDAFEHPIRIRRNRQKPNINIYACTGYYAAHCIQTRHTHWAQARQLCALNFRIGRFNYRRATNLMTIGGNRKKIEMQQQPETRKNHLSEGKKKRVRIVTRTRESSLMSCSTTSARRSTVCVRNSILWTDFFFSVGRLFVHFT